jgi:hypothetical protein
VRAGCTDVSGLSDYEVTRTSASGSFQFVVQRNLGFPHWPMNVVRGYRLCARDSPERGACSGKRMPRATNPKW